MEIGLVGLPTSGKTMLFRALTGSAKGGSRGGSRGSGQAAAQVGAAKVPDPRLDTIAQFIETKKIVPATLQVVDIPGFATGGEASAFGRQVLAHIREVDAVCHVVRCFRGVDGSQPRARAEIESMEMEMVLGDLAVAEPALDKATRGARSGDREVQERAAALQKVIPVLEDGRPIRAIASDLSQPQQAALRGYGMLTAKPVLYVANVSEDDLAGTGEAARQVRGYAEETAGECIALCAQLEAEIAELAEQDRPEMLESMGIAEPALGRMARSLYALLGLTSFYTAGEKEIRAWPIPRGATAPEAAGAIHSDIQRGFIRAECYHVDELAEHRSEKAIKEAGRLRSEGKGYIMQDGDVVHFLFNV